MRRYPPGWVGGGDIGLAATFAARLRDRITMGNIVPIALRALVGMARRHAPIEPVDDKAHEQAGMLGVGDALQAGAVVGKLGLDLVP